MVELQKLSVKILLPSERYGPAKVLYAFREAYEPELVWFTETLTANAVVVDAGANYGMYSMPAARRVGPSGLVLTFEPARRTAAVLRESVRLNGFTNVRVLEMALGHREGRAFLRHDRNPGRNCLLAKLTEPVSVDGEEVKLATLDGVLVREGVEKVDFLKIDVEGAEQLVLRGSLATLESWHPTILFEHNPGATRRLDLPVDGAWKLLESMGYRFFRFGLHDSLVPLKDLPGSFVNVIASCAS
jgi:FkbM family methyltransferase